MRSRRKVVVHQISPQRILGLVIPGGIEQRLHLCQRIVSCDGRPWVRQNRLLSTERASTDARASQNSQQGCRPAHTSARSSQNDHFFAIVFAEFGSSIRTMRSPATLVSVW